MAKSVLKQKLTGILVEQIRGCARCERSQVQSLKALGLGKIGRKRRLKDDACIRGLINKVSHLVKVGDSNG
jgi:large subunit ribosomal protein L30